MSDMAFRDLQVGSDFLRKFSFEIARYALAGGLFLPIFGCDQIPDLNQPKPGPLAEQAAASGDYPKAVRFYEASLDGTEKTADVHQRLAIIYESYLKDPVSALHHYRRYAKMVSAHGSGEDVAGAISRLERQLAIRLGEGGLVSKGEAVRLRNENLALRKQLATLRGEKPPAAATPPPVDAKGYSKAPQTRTAEQAVGAETRTYTVLKGDTLASISRKFYHTSNRWKDIVDANHNQLNGGTAIREGQVLVIP